MEALGAGTWYWDRRSGVVDWDPALEALYGLSEGAFGGRFDDWVGCIHPDDRDTVLATLDQTLATGGPHRVVYRTVHPDGSVRWIEGRGKVVRDDDGEVVGMVGACRDITERQELDAERARMLDAERSARERLELLAEASDLLARSLNVDEQLHELAQLAVPPLADLCVIDVRDRPQLHVSAVAHRDPDMAEKVRGFRQRFGSVMDRAAGRSLLADGFYPAIDDELLGAIARDEEHLHALRQAGLQSAVIVPLHARGRRVGALALVHMESGRHHSRQDYMLARELARRAAVAVDNARLFSERSRVAHVLQRALLPPKLPEIPGVELASRFDTAEGTEIGGDFYDALGAGTDWTLVIGDVRGKGAEAASLASLARHTVRAAALRNPDPGNVLAVLNEALIEHDPWESFCTAVCVNLQLRRDRVRVDLAAGGHPPPLLLHADGSLTTVQIAGPLIGLLDDAIYTTTTLTLDPGDLLFLYTDGLTEARRGDELFGTGRVETALRAASGLGAEAVLKHVHAAVDAFQARQRDDVALLALRPMPSA